MMARLVAWALPVLALLGSGAAAQEGRPAPWFLKFTHGSLESHSLTYKDGSSRTFYYLTFKVTNASQQDAKLALHFDALVGSNPKKQRHHYAVPMPDAEEAIRRLARAPGLKNVQQINKLGTLSPGQSVQGIAVFSAFNREWDVATIMVSGLEPYTKRCRVRKYGEAGFTVWHRAYYRHNQEVLKKAGKDAAWTEAQVIIRQNVVWKMKYFRQGDEFAPQLDPITLDTEGWDVKKTQIIYENKVPFGS